MDYFKNKDEYFLYLDKFQRMSLTNLKILKKTKNIEDFKEREIHDYYILRINANPATLAKVKEGMDKKLFDHLNGFDLTNELDILDLYMIISSLNEMKYHKKLNMSTDGYEFTREIKKIKKDANRVFAMSTNKDITLKLPQPAHLIKYALIEYFKVRSTLSDESIKNISLLFGKRMPRSKVKYTDKIHNFYSKLGESILKNTKDGHTPTAIYYSINDDSTYKDYIEDTEKYTPKE